MTPRLSGRAIPCRHGGSSSDDFMNDSTPDRPRLLLLAFSRVESDARVLRQARYLAPHFDVTLAGFGKKPAVLADVAGLDWFELGMKATESRWDVYWRRAAAWLARVHPWFLSVYCRHVPYMRFAWHLAQTARYRVIYCNDVDTLPMAAAALKSNGFAKIIFDVHDYSTRQSHESAYWRWERKPFVTAILNHLARRAHGTVTVVESFVPILHREFRMKKPLVVWNAPELVPLPARPAPDGKIHLIHHGGCLSLRKLELMIHMMAHAGDRYVLHMMLTRSEPAYLDFLKQEAAKLPAGTVVFEDPVLPHQIVPEISRYDIGVFLLPPVTFNYEHALPNKFFDFMGAGLAIMVGPSPNMASMVREHGLGWVTEDFEPETMGRMLAGLSEEDISAKRRASLEAREKFNAATEMAKLVALVKKVAHSKQSAEA